MTNQTETYVTLKPIAERFANIANSITDDEIRSLIKSEMREQIGRIDFGRWVATILDAWTEDNVETINTLALKCVQDKLR